MFRTFNSQQRITERVKTAGLIPRQMKMTRLTENGRTRYDVGDRPDPGKSYELIAPIGSGAFGEVWKARSTSSGKTCAIKIISDLHRRGGQKEFRSLQLVKEINHPNLVPIIDFWLKDRQSRFIRLPTVEPQPVAQVSRQTLRADCQETKRNEIHCPQDFDLGNASELIIAMGYGDKTLQHRLKECQKEGLPGIPRDELFRYMDGAARAIDLLNGKNIQHCDIKPANILIVGGDSQVCDFGLAQAIGPDVRATMNPAYTPAYADPALEAGMPSLSTDLYSLAVTYVELRTGQLPFPTDNLLTLYDAKRVGKLQIDSLDECEKDLIRRALEPHPKNRLFLSCSSFIEELKDCHVCDIPSPRQSMWKVWAAAAACITVAFVACLVLLLSGPNSDKAVQESIDRMLQREDFVDAWTELIQIEDTDLRAALESKIARKWHAKIDLRSENNELGSTLNEITIFLARYPDYAPARSTRKEAILELLSQADQMFSNENRIPIANVELVLGLDPKSLSSDEVHLLDRAWLLWSIAVGDKAEANGKLAQKRDARLESATENILERPNLAVLKTHLATQGNDVLHRILVANKAENEDPALAIKTIAYVSNEASAIDDAHRKSPDWFKEFPSWYGPLWSDVDAKLADEYVQWIDDGAAHLSSDLDRTIKRIVSDGIELQMAKVRNAIQNFEFETAESILDASTQLFGGDTKTLHQIQVHRLLLRFANPSSVNKELSASATEIAKLESSASRIGEALRFYVLAVAHDSVGNTDKAASYASDAVQYYSNCLKSGKKPALTTEHVQRAALIVIDHVDALRVKTVAIDKNPFSTVDADKSLAYLRIIRQLTRRSESEMKLGLESGKKLLLNLATASFCQSENRRHPDEIIQYVDEYLGQNPNDGLPIIHLTRAEAFQQRKNRTESDRRESIHSYRNTLRCWKALSEENNYQTETGVVFRRVVEPAIRLAKDLGELRTDSSLTKALAEICACRGEMIRVGGVWRDHATRAKQAYISYKKAHELDNGKVEYLIGFGLSLIEYKGKRDPRSIIGELNDIASRARMIDKEQTQVSKLLGYVKIIQSQVDIEPADEWQSLNQAMKHLDVAITRAKSAEDPELYIYRCLAQVGIAYLMPKYNAQQRDAVKKILNEAVRDGQRALDLSNSSKIRAQASLAAGNAVEDLAHYTYETHRFDEAVRLFESAQEGFDSMREAHVAMCRCLYRKASTLNGSKAKSTLLDAKEKLSKLRPNGWLDARREFWLGEIELALADMEGKDRISKAKQHFINAENNAKNADRYEWANYALKIAHLDLKHDPDIEQLVKLTSAVIDAYLSEKDVSESQFIDAMEMALEALGDEAKSDSITSWLQRVDENAHRARVELVLRRIELRGPDQHDIDLVQSLMAAHRESVGGRQIFTEEFERWRRICDARIEYVRAYQYHLIKQYANSARHAKRAQELVSPYFEEFLQYPSPYLARKSALVYEDAVLAHAVSVFKRFQLNSFDINDREREETIGTLRHLLAMHRDGTVKLRDSNFKIANTIIEYLQEE